MRATSKATANEAALSSNKESTNRSYFIGSNRADDHGLYEMRAFMYNSPRTIAQRKAIDGAMKATPEQEHFESVQTSINHTGIPDSLKAGIENLSGYSMDNVKVHYNSPKPSRLRAYAYAQGTEIHLAPGQEEHLPHEAWHVVQQKQGRVEPMLQTGGGVKVNNDQKLEQEADRMGRIAAGPHAGELSLPSLQAPLKTGSGHLCPVVQRLDSPLKPEDNGKLYRLKLGNEIVIGRFSFQGRNGIHNFTQIGGEDDGQSLRIHYVNIIEEVTVNEEKIDQFLQDYEKKESLTLRVKEEAQRLKLDVTDSEILKGQLNNRSKSKAKKYIDLTYHETVQYINQEYAKFCAEAEKTLNPLEVPVAYDRLLARQTVTISESEVQATGPSPLTTMTPALLGKYQDMHYKTRLQVKDDTASTRAYEADYTKQVTQKLPFSHWRAFVLPKDLSQDETSMVDAIGGTLDVQTPTSGQTIGQGKIYSAIYKHFQKSMELLNHRLDGLHEEYTLADNTQKNAEDVMLVDDDVSEGEKAFEKRTRLHMTALESSYLAGLYANEEAGFDPGKGFLNWPDLKLTIDNLVREIVESIQNVPEDMHEDLDIYIRLNDLKGSNPAIVKQFELIGAIIGLMIKKEKRQVLNCQMFGTDEQVKQHLENLYRLMRVENVINEQIPRCKWKIGQLIRNEQERRSVLKELL